MNACLYSNFLLPSLLCLPYIRYLWYFTGNVQEDGRDAIPRGSWSHLQLAYFLEDPPRVPPLSPATVATPLVPPLCRIMQYAVVILE